MTEFRVVVSGFHRANEHLMPHSALKDVWLRRLFPLKKPVFVDRYGVSLMGIELKHLPVIDDTKDFELICSENGLGSPLNRSVRILVSDGPISKLPITSPEHDALIAIQVGQPESWRSHNLNQKVTQVEIPSNDIKYTIIDILLDFSFANSFTPQFVFSRTIPNRTDLFRKKVQFALDRFQDLSSKLGLVKSSPYVSFSALARIGNKFGSDGHIETFVKIWDEFFASIVGESNSRSLTADMICNYPKIGKQLSPDAVATLLAGASTGTHLFLARRRSKERASSDVQGRLHALFSSLPHRGTGVRETGLLPIGRFDSLQESLLEQVERLANEGYLYVIRVHVRAES
ncbi:MAG: hypothetical protein KDA53_13300 [Hyphomonas sp.]|nr:hypothetical protein [Hyphomonas sp.]